MRVSILRRSCLLLTCLLVPACASSSESTPGDPVVDAGHDTDLDAKPDTPADAPDAQPEAEPDAPDDGPSVTCTPDEDGDNIPDEVEGRSDNRDSDDDGTPDYLDTDSDDDSLPDAFEGNTSDVGCLTPLDSDGDGTPDYADTDSDDNGVDDRDEVYPDGSPYDPANPQPNPADTDDDKRPDYVDKDNDGDGMDDVTELGGLPSQDTDDDGLHDIFDPDSDDDTIRDGHEGTTDFDENGVPNFRDEDSDGDGILDACEAGPGHTIEMLPVDTDLDGKFDFVDLDSDSDGLLDAEEDADGDCVVDAGETSPALSDTDGDGADDLIEVTLESDPGDPVVTPESLGKFYFKIPYQDLPAPDEHTLAIKTTLSRADVGFLVDTTGTMAEELNALKAGLQQVIQILLLDIPDMAVGVAAFDDYPVDPYGAFAQSDLPFYLPSPAGRISTVAADSLAAVNQLVIHAGGDIPESQVAAMWLALTNNALQWPGVYWPPSQIPSGRFGALAFRNDAFPIIVTITDAPFHNGRRIGSPSILHDTYSFNSTADAPTVDDLVDALHDKGARFIGFASDNGVRSGDPYEDMAYVADQTSSFVHPSAFGGACTTGIGGVPLPQPDGPNGTCRLVFDVYKNGDGLTERIVDAIQGLLKGLLLEMRVVAVSDPVEPPLFVDTVDEFVSHVTVSQSGGDDPTEPGVPCFIVNSSSLADKWSGPKGWVQGGDTHNETVLDVVPTTKICFNVFPKMNVTVPATDEAQVFHAQLQVKARRSQDSEIDLGQPRDVLFVVPPKPQ